MTRPIGIAAPAVTVAFAVLFVVCWSSGFVGAKLGAQEFDVRTVLVWRFVPLAAVLAAVTWRRRRRTPVGRAELLRQIAIGLLSQSGYLLTVYWAIDLGVSTGTTALIDGTQPLVVAALVGPLLGMALRGRQWIGLLLGLVGVAVVTFADASSAATEAAPWAYAIPFGGMACLVAATFVERRGTAPAAPLRNLTIHCSTSAVVFALVAGLGGVAAPPADRGFWVATIWLIVFPTFGGYGLYWLLMDRVGITTVNSLLFLVPPVTTTWGALMFGEPVTALTIAGLVLALVATWLVTVDGSHRPPRTR
jgi:drug/metabolite transporter (DMT)-like permease